MVKFGYTIFYVTDVTKSIQFYEDSFGVTRKFITPENDYAELATGNTTIAFASKELANSNLQNGFI
jgi:lactoylglutathione lyase